MEELIFFGLIIFFSILDGIVRKKRQGGAAELPELPDSAEWNDPAPRPRGEVSTYDADPSYDDVWKAEMPGGGGRRYQADEPAAADGPRVPSDIWEEIAALARGESRAPPPAGVDDMASAPREGVGGSGLPARRPPASPIRRSEVGTGGDLTEHAIHRAHAGYGTDPSSRRPSLPATTDARESRDVRAVKDMLAGGRSQLRRAVILQETLGPPVSLRDEGHL